MMNASRFCAVAVAAAIIAIACGPAFADPLPNEVLKFYQTPLNNGLAVYPPGAFPNPGDFAAPFPGHDEWSTATQIAPGQYQGYYMADDFSDNYSTPIAHVMWWGSYQNNLRDGGAQKFLITFESDVPVGPGNPLGYSHPGSVISSQIVTLGPLAPQSGTFTETPVVPGPLGPPSPDGTLWQYNAELALPAPEAAGQVEWIKIVALKDNPSEPWMWGWHDRDYGIRDPLASPVPVPGEYPFPTGLPFPNPGWHFQDDAVTGPIFINALSPFNITVDQQAWTPTNYIPAYDGIDYSKDLAFALYTIVPEPSTVMLLTMGSVGLIVTALRRRRSR